MLSFLHLHYYSTMKTILLRYHKLVLSYKLIVPTNFFIYINERNLLESWIRMYCHIILMLRVAKASEKMASLNACFMRVSCTLNRVPHKQNC